MPTKLEDFVATFLKVKRPIVQYIRDKAHRKIGVMLAYKYDNSNVVVGWSKVNLTAGDEFNREYGIARALDHDKLMLLDEFQAFSHQLPNVPKIRLEDGSRITQYDDFIFRAKNYFASKKTDKKKVKDSQPLEKQVG